MINSYFKYIKTALEGAKYHEELAFLFAHPKRNEFNKIVFHLRAYFWELWSVWDYVLQYVNVKTLKLDPYDVRRDLLKKIKANMPYYQYLPLLEKIQNEDRLYRIMWLRDHAHKWQINPYLVDYNDEGVQVISCWVFCSKNIIFISRFRFEYLFRESHYVGLDFTDDQISI